MSPVVQFLIALIGLGVAIDYALLVVSRWREERAHGPQRRRGGRSGRWSPPGRAVVFSGLTVAIGLLALFALPVPFLRSMGYGGMLIPLVSTLVAITLLPVVLATVGPRLDWPHRRTDDKASRAWTRWAAAGHAPPLGRRRRRAGRDRRARGRRAAAAARRLRRLDDREVGERQGRARRARALRHRRGRAARRTRSSSPARPTRRRSPPRVARRRRHPRRGRARRRRVAPRRHRDRRAVPVARQRHRTPAATTLDRRARRRPRCRARRARRRRPGRRTPTSSTRSTAASR